MPSVRPIYLELQRPQWNIYLDNHLHYILLGLVRPHRRHPFTPHHHRRSQHWRLPHIRFHLNSLFPLHFHQQVLSRRIPLYSNDIYGSNGTIILNSMAYSSHSSSSITGTTYTITEFTSPTSRQSPSASCDHYIDTHFNYSSTHSSKSCPKGPRREKDGETTSLDYNDSVNPHY